MGKALRCQRSDARHISAAGAWLRNFSRALPTSAGSAITIVPVTARRTAMIGYVTLGTNDLQRAAKFYDALLAEVGGKRAMEMESFIAWATAPNTPMISVIK